MYTDDWTPDALYAEIEHLREQVAALSAALNDSKRVDLELKVAQAFQQSILDCVADPIMVIDQDYRVILMNRAAREFSCGEAIHPPPIYCYQVSHQMDAPCNGLAHPCPLEQVRETHQQATLLHEHYTATGEQRLLEIHAAPICDSEGHFQGIVESMRDVTERTRAARELQRRTDRVRALAAQLTEVAEAERKRLARELHDLVGQNLSVLAINLNIIQSQLDAEAGDHVFARIKDSLSLVEETTERTRDVMTRLRPPILDDCGLVAALHWYGEKFTRRTDVPVSVKCAEPDLRLVPRVEDAMFRIYQEALTNVAKHAQATTVTVTFEVDDRMSRLSIADDGVGFLMVPNIELDRERGWGLLTMIERAEAVGGHCRIESVPEHGTQVVVEVPR